LRPRVNINIINKPDVEPGLVMTETLVQGKLSAAVLLSGRSV